MRTIAYDENMPTRNIVKEYGEGEYYHVYNRGVNKSLIFYDEFDYGYFLNLFKKYLSPEPARDSSRRLLPNYAHEVELVAYCLMPNHYHLMFYLKEKQGIEHVMRSVMTAYSMYVNRRHKRVGALFQNHFLASRITNDSYFWQVARYIHLNPLDIHQSPLNYPYSSIEYIRGSKSAEWLHASHLVGSSDERRRFVDSLYDGEEYHELYHNLRHELAN